MYFPTLSPRRRSAFCSSLLLVLSLAVVFGYATLVLLMLVLGLSATEAVFLAARAFGADQNSQIAASVRVLKAAPFGVAAAMLGKHTMPERAVWFSATFTAVSFVFLAELWLGWYRRGRKPDSSRD